MSVPSTISANPSSASTDASERLSGSHASHNSGSSASETGPDEPIIEGSVITNGEVIDLGSDKWERERETFREETRLPLYQWHLLRTGDISMNSDEYRDKTVEYLAIAIKVYEERGKKLHEDWEKGFLSAMQGTKAFPTDLYTGPSMDVISEAYSNWGLKKGSRKGVIFLHLATCLIEAVLAGGSTKDFRQPPKSLDWRLVNLVDGHPLDAFESRFGSN